MALDTTTVRRIAALARIRVPEDELVGLASELSRILDWIEQLNEVDTEGVPPLASVADTEAPLRADEVTSRTGPDAVLANSPSGEPDYFTVPKVVE